LPNSIENLGSQILERLATIESQVTTVKNHASQNGGWVKKICDPEEGVIARLRDVEQWQRDSEMKLGSENQNNRMIKIETRLKQILNFTSNDYQ
jgi:hypothetical protein